MKLMLRLNAMADLSIDESGSSLNAIESQGDGATRSTKSVTGLTYVGRAFTILVLLAVSLWTCRNWSFILGRAKPITPVASSHLNSHAGQLGEIAESNGTWTFAGLPWELSIRTVRSDEIDSNIMRPVERQKFEPATRDGEAELIQFAESFEVPCVVTDVGRVFRFDSDGVRAIIRTLKMDDGERVEVARLAFFDSNLWTLYDVIPSYTNGDSKAGGVDHLLPLPASAEQTCARHTTDGTLLLEIVGVNKSRDELIKVWSRHGWSIEKHKTPGGTTLVCTLGSSQILAWAEPRRDDALTQLVLFRNPSH